MKKRREKEALQSRIIPMEERAQSNHLFVEAIPVRYRRSGEVNPEWLSACKEERNLTSNLMEQMVCPLNLGKAYRRVKSNGGSAGVDGMRVEDLQKWLGENLTNLQAHLLSP